MAVTSGIAAKSPGNDSFDANSFKRAVKDWIRKNPEGSLADLTDFCDDQIPAAQYANWQWLVDQTVSWYGHILNHREATAAGKAGFEDDEATSA